MVARKNLFTSLTAAVLAGLVQNAEADCKCFPGDSCWPSDAAWAALNITTSGNLIRNVPLAAPCYPGTHQDDAACTDIKANWANSLFHAKFHTGYDFPHTWACDLPGRNSSSCSLGESPVYSINATNPEAISAGLKFAKEHNLRVTIKNTGHDFLGRSAGAGSLEIWTRYLRPSTQSPVVFHDVYAPTVSCAAVQKGSSSYWGGSSVQLGGAVTFDDVYPQAHQKGVVVVGGTCHSVGMTGGYLQGGGHGAAMHQYGLGADQVLEYNVVLANGEDGVPNG